jgi:hypothetical protein
MKSYYRSLQRKIIGMVTGGQVKTVYDIYLRRGRETVHVFRWNGHPDPERTNRLFQEMIEADPYASTLKSWDRLALFRVRSDNGITFPRLRKPGSDPWFGPNPVTPTPAK